MNIRQIQKKKAESVNLKIEVKILIKEMRRQDLPSIQRLRLRLPMQAVWVWPPVGELRSHKVCGTEQPTGLENLNTSMQNYSNNNRSHLAPHTTINSD